MFILHYILHFFIVFFIAKTFVWMNICIYSEWNKHAERIYEYIRNAIRCRMNIQIYLEEWKETNIYDYEYIRRKIFECPDIRYTLQQCLVAQRMLFICCPICHNMLNNHNFKFCLDVNKIVLLDSIKIEPLILDIGLSTENLTRSVYCNVSYFCIFIFPEWAKFRLIILKK